MDAQTFAAQLVGALLAQLVVGFAVGKELQELRAWCVGLAKHVDYKPPPTSAAHRPPPEH